MSIQEHILPECPSSPNCNREQVLYQQVPDTLFSVTKQALNDLNPVEAFAEDDSLTMHAVFRIPVFGWKDDVHIVVQPADDSSSSVLHIRSASRIGYSDLGVNKRRIQTIKKSINTYLSK
ncbi:MAG: DUF1499 domain-containing protein [Bacteroidota bacterium]